MTSLIRMLATAFLATLGLSVEVRAQPMCGREFATAEALGAELTRGAEKLPLPEAAPYAAYADKTTVTVWTLTKPGHPAHPAVVCRKPEEEAGAVVLRMEARCGGPKPACDAMVAAFQALPTGQPKRN